MPWVWQVRAQEAAATAAAEAAQIEADAAVARGAYSQEEWWDLMGRAPTFEENQAWGRWRKREQLARGYSLSPAEIEWSRGWRAVGGYDFAVGDHARIGRIADDIYAEAYAAAMAAKREAAEAAARRERNPWVRLGHGLAALLMLPFVGAGYLIVAAAVSLLLVLLLTPFFMLVGAHPWVWLLLLL